MTIGEFKAFLEGMDVKGVPTPDQWARIKEKIETLEASIPPTVPAIIPHVNPGTVYLTSQETLAGGDDKGYPFTQAYVTACRSTKSVDGQVM